MTVARATPDPAHPFAAATVEKWITETGLDRTTAARIRDAIRIYTACLDAPPDITAAVRTLASCDHFDQARRAARNLPDDLPIVDILRAADGATRLAHDLDLHRRLTA